MNVFELWSVYRCFVDMFYIQTRFTRKMDWRNKYAM